MKVLLALNFFIFAAIQFGLLLGILHYLKGESKPKPNPYWILALITSVTGLTFFAIGLLNTDDIQKVPPIFTPANTLFYAAAIFQGLFFYSFHHSVSKSLKLALGLSILCYGLFFEYLRQNWTFEARTIFVVSTYAIILTWQIREARMVNRDLGLQQLRYFQYAAIGEALFLVPRLIVLLGSNHPINTMEQLPQLLIIFTYGQILMNTISFIAIWGYWSEKLALENRLTVSETEEVKNLLQEREALIISLLKANKTITTGALSASIAHEINQPLGAIQINSEYLQKKIQEPQIDREQVKQIAKEIERDNMRAAQIIKILKLIFTEKYSAVPTFVAVQEAIDSVLLLSRSEFMRRRIEMEINIEPGLQIPVSFGEAEQLFLNLLNNSAQALERSSNEPKRIHLIAKRHEDKSIIRIEDNGCGVPIDRQDSLFDLFATTKHEGMGLGLWLCQYIVTRNGGKINFDQNFNQGAAFEIEFPSLS
ncbi:MAG: GHKL domain-containing protein [Burkholderiaceae bacterium]|nr:GHKL domain-containing protein [Burkholderiaceae bacterium]